MNGYLFSRSDGDPELDLRGLLAVAKGFAPAQLLLTAVELRVFAVLGPGPLGVDELRERLDLHRRGCRPFLDALVDHGLLVRDGARYANTAIAARHLDANGPDYVGGWLRLTGGLYWLWPNLAASLRTGLPLAGPGDESGSHPREWDSTYVDAMAVGARAAAAAVATALDWPRYGSFLDLGGSNGTFARELVRRHVALRGICFDQPSLRDQFDRASEAAPDVPPESVRFVGGDIASDPLPTSDVVVLGRILHNCSEEERLALLMRVRAAVPDTGAVLVFDQLIGEAGAECPEANISSLDQLLFSDGGGEYTLSELHHWLRRAGFGRQFTQRIGNGPETLVVAFADAVAQADHQAVR